MLKLSFNDAHYFVHHLKQRSQTHGPQTSKNSAVFFKYTDNLTIFQLFLVFSWKFEGIFLLISMQPARPFFESHADRRSLWLWDSWPKAYNQNQIFINIKRQNLLLKLFLSILGKHLWLLLISVTKLLNKVCSNLLWLLI